MSNHTIAILLYVLVGLNIVFGLARVAMVGEERPAVSAREAVYTVASGGLVCVLEVLAAGRLLHG